MYKLQFTLKQHTPLIHFQHEQDGATLRATEVKPKLDRFIYYKWLQAENGNEEAIFKKYGHLTVSFCESQIQEEIKKYDLLNPEKKREYLKSFNWALDYKLRIEAGEKLLDFGSIEKKYTDRNGRERQEKFPNFFGLMGDTNAQSKAFVSYNRIKCTLVSTYGKLVTHLKTCLMEFFLKHNFGNRQSKGFGAFLPENINDEIINVNTQYLKYWFDVQITTPRDIYTYTEDRSQKFKEQFELFRIIELMYAVLRNGLNQNRGQDSVYIKSLLFLYAKSKGIQWEKKRIKEVFFPEYLKQQINAHKNAEALTYQSQETRLMRDVFGLASESQWYTYNNDTVIKTSSAIERFKSPLLIKPIHLEGNKYRITFEVIDKPTGFFDSSFTINSKNKRNTFDISTPKNFDYDDFFHFAFTQDITKLAEYKNLGSRNSKDVALLKDIFQQVKSNANW